MKSNQIVLLLIGLSWLPVVFPKLMIYESSDDLKHIFKEGIKYNQAAFGHYTYNKQFIG
jgi:hypothetical protein